MAVIEWKKILIPYDQAVEELKIKFKSIRKEYRKMEEYSPIEFVTGRVKEISSILEKANKLNIPIDKIESGIEDIAGIRIMCQFVDDIEKVAQIIRNRKDMSIIYEKDYIRNFKESGYRSYHIIINYPVNLAENHRVIFAEIQIRTLAMNFWATMEHSLNYKYKHNIPEEIKKRLKAAAEAAFQLDQQMMEIKEEIKDAQKLFEVKSSLVSNIMNNIISLSSMGKISKAMDYRTQLSKLVDEGELIDLQGLLRQVESELGKI